MAQKKCSVPRCDEVAVMQLVGVDALPLWFCLGCGVDLRDRGYREATSG